MSNSIEPPPIEPPPIEPPSIETIKQGRTREYPTVAAKRLEILKSIDALDEFSSKEHYAASVLYLLEKAEDGKMTLARIQMVHPNHALVNKVLKSLGKVMLEKIKDGVAVIFRLTDKYFEQAKKDRVPDPSKPKIPAEKTQTAV